ncbi:MAG: hypothetical protein M3007_07945, partial [Candidatus Eremiobacteraeota bacterium]|nr:hypothetical protein [Candidatus Eremiobacteraeota bacterium]
TRPIPRKFRWNLVSAAQHFLQGRSMKRVRASSRKPKASLLRLHAKANGIVICCVIWRGQIASIVRRKAHKEEMPK